MVVYIAFNKRSVLTAKALQQSLSLALGDGNEVRLINKKRFKKKPDFLIRWGNSYIECPEGCIDINPKEAVENASDKLKMANKLKDCPEAMFPKSVMQEDITNKELVNQLISESPTDKIFWRNSVDAVRFRSNSVPGDKYALVDIDKDREFRVHIFNDRTIGVYEKIPHEGTDANIRKNDNCDFRRMDMANQEVKSSLKGVRPAARAAVKALGLTFGGADVMISKNGKIFVNEVNSAPSLNGPNLERWSEVLAQEISGNKE